MQNFIWNSIDLMALTKFELIIPQAKIEIKLGWSF